jgi:hypothetical protein
MRRRRALAPVLVVGVLAAVPVALASQPRANAAFTGTGTTYANNAPKWHRQNGAPAPFSFKTNANGTRVTSFKGQFSAYCGVPSASVTAAYMTVSKRGTFSYKFSTPRVFRGKAVGRTYVWIYGKFSSSRTASVAYLINISGLHDKHPYDTAKPRSLGCATWVRGTAHAH